jgi:hypothetical protein
MKSALQFEALILNQEYGVTVRNPKSGADNGH